LSRGLVIPNKIKYFGFSIVDCHWNDPLDSSNKTNYTNEVRGYTNIAQLCVFRGNYNISIRLKYFKQNSIKAILSIESILFDHIPAATGSGRIYKLRPDWKSQWINFATINKDTLTTDYVAALYIVDEPFWNSLPYNDLAMITRFLKIKHPMIPLFFIEAYPALSVLKIPPEIDWIGFDHYGVFAPQSDLVYKKELRTLKQKMYAHQKIVLVMESQWLKEYDQIPADPSLMATVARNYFKLSKSDLSIIGMIGYPWAGGLDDPTQKGARNLPLNVRQTYRQIGQEVLNNF
jgi:hypothetical protein